MNRYPIWKYIIILLSLIVAVIYTLPNLYGEAPAVQVSAGKVTTSVNSDTLTRVQALLSKSGLNPNMIGIEGASVRARFDSTDEQIKAKDLIEHELNQDPNSPDYVVALNLVSRSPAWLSKLNAYPMYLGLDLRGGVHFMLQVDMQAAITKHLDTLTNDIRLSLRDKDIRHAGISRQGQSIEVKMRDAADIEKARISIVDTVQNVQVNASTVGDAKLIISFTPQELQRVQADAVKQNITTLHNRVNELGVAEPVILQQGLDRVVVQLPGVQDVAKAKSILGRTATLEMRLVDESSEGRAAEAGGPVPFGSEKFSMRDGTPVIVKRQVILTGDRLSDAQPGFDSHSNQPKVDLVVDGVGGRIMRDTSRENIQKRMAIVLFEKGKGEVITAPVIQGELGNRFQISGSMGVAEASDLALLLRAGSLAAPMEIIEERTIGPSLGAENISKGFNSVKWGFIVVVAFMIIYYALFGVFSSMALGFNLLLLVSVLSMLQATLTLPGIAAMALALGMAIDANVLINERIREELRNGVAPQSAIFTGYDRAWATILDSNITSLVAGVALLTFGSGPVRGFAVVHCLGILTSMFSAVFFSRGMVNLWYGRQKKLKTVSIGTVWRDEKSNEKANGKNEPAPASQQSQ